MRIVFVTPEFISEKETFDGGLSNYLFRISKSLTAEGHKPVIITRSFTENNLIDYEGIEVHRVMIIENRVIRFLKKLTNNKIDTSIYFQYMSWVLNKYLNDNLANIKPDIIQYASYTGTAFYRIKKVPSVVRISSYEKFLRKAKGITNPTKDDLRIEWIENYSLKKADAIYGPSNLTALAIKDDLKLDVKVIETPFINPTLQLDNSVYKEYLEGKEYLLYFGSLSKVKGVHIIAEILEKLFNKYPNLYFAFVGKDIGLKEEIINKSKQYSNRVIFINPIPHATLYPIISNSKAVILPSVSDNFPNTCIEAMALGKVVVGTLGTSFEQLIDDNVSGFLSKPSDPEDLLKTVEKVLGLNAQQKSAISIKAKDRIKLLKPEVITNQLIAFYKESIKSFKIKSK